jgi:hypothetical protein
MKTKSSPLLGPLFSLGSSLGSNFITNRGTRKAEESARRHNLRMWNMQNAYNHPLKQMQRLEEAGLNPNLIYGGSTGASVGNAGSQPAPARAASFNLDSPMTPYMQTAVQQAQTSNLDQGAVLKATQAIKVGEDAKLTKTQRQLLDKNFKNLVIQEQNKALQSVLTSQKLSSEVKRAATEAQTAIINQGIQKSKSKVEKLRAALAKDGITPTDNIWVRIMQTLFNNNKSDDNRSVFDKLILN